MNLRFKKVFKLTLDKKTYTIIFKNSRSLKYGNFGIQSKNWSLVTYSQINSFRIKISRYLKKFENLKSKMYIRVFFIRSFTQKPKLTRMGKGSGSIKGWLGVIKPGMIFLELNSTIPSYFLREICIKASHLLSMNVNFIYLKE